MVEKNNEAFVATLKNIRKIEGADKIVCADIILNNIHITQVVVGVDTKENTPIVYFDSNLSINQEVIDKIDKLSPDYGKEDFKGLNTYLANGNRIRCIKLKGTISNGLAVEVEKFYQFFNNIEEAKNILIEGYSFTHINDVEICKKWLPPVQRTSNKNNKEHKGNKKVSRIIPELFHFHIDTQMLLKNLYILQPEQIISLSRKIHGCVSENTIVNTKEFGDKTIGELVKNKIKCNIKAYDINNKQVVFVPIDDFYYKENDGDWYEIELENGIKLEITGNNPVWLSQLNCYRKVEQLLVGDVLLVD